jgi:hypothetical protein
LLGGTRIGKKREIKSQTQPVWLSGAYCPAG